MGRASLSSSFFGSGLIQPYSLARQRPTPAPLQLKLPQCAVAQLDEGEAEAIALAKELATDLLLLDERRGRAIASCFGLRFIGLLGVPIEAKQRGCLLTVKPVLDDLVAKAGFWVSQQLYTRVLQAAGE